MPYFKNDDINLLLIHIPKTGGTSLELYFSKKYSIELCNKSLFYYSQNEFYTNVESYHSMPEYQKIIFKNISLQHFTFSNIKQLNSILKVDFNDLQIITAVRNPYDRIISDLFFFNLITETTTPEQVYDVINKYIYSNYLDNHNIPQYMFLLDENNNMITNLTILRTETLTSDMIKLGYTDFNVNQNKNRYEKVNYSNYLNNDSINLINKYYEKDFIYFGYDMKNIN